MIATLPMYDWAGQHRHWDALWAAIRDRIRSAGLPAPDSLSRGESFWDQWQSPDLVLGQTCGMPYRERLHGRVELVGALDHGLPGAPPGYYYSVMVAAADAPKDFTDYAGATLACNGLDSESGWAAPQNEAARHGFRFARFQHTGAHRDSAIAVAEGRAEIAAIDAETWRLVETYLPEVAAKLRVIHATQPTPGLPLIAAKGADAPRLADAIEAALADCAPETLDALHVRGFVRIPAEDYLAVKTPPIPSQDTPAT